MAGTDDPFNEFEEVLAQKGQSEALDFLAGLYRKAGQFPELFEILKAKIRIGLKLPAISHPDAPDQIDESKRRLLEDQLLDACSEIGIALLNDGQFRNAWVYLQPLLDQQQVQEAFCAANVTEQNVDEFIEIALYGGASPEKGFQWMIKQQGTCNGITYLETHGTQLPPQIQSNLAQQLIEHIHDELYRDLISDLSSRENEKGNNDSSAPGTLHELIAANPSLFNACGHHLDVTHLATAVRIGRRCQTEKSLMMAQGLAQYGMQLDPQLVYESEPPFEDTYRDHYRYFCGRLNQDLETSLKHFRNKLDSMPSSELALIAQEVIIEMLVSAGQSTRAIEEYALAPELWFLDAVLPLAQSEQDNDLISQCCRDRNDLLGFGLSKIAGGKN